jgi:hypothetical protein
MFITKKTSTWLQYDHDQWEQGEWEGGIWQSPNLLKKHNKGNTKTTMEVELVTKPIVICYCENHN